MKSVVLLLFGSTVYNRDLQVLTHSFPTRRSSELKPTAEPVREQRPVRQARNRVVKRHVADSGFSLPAIGNVAEMTLNDLGAVDLVEIADHLHIDRGSLAGFDHPVLLPNAVCQNGSASRRDRVCQYG